MHKPIFLNHRLWEGESTIELALPARWNVQVLRMNGDGKRVLGESDYDASLLGLMPQVRGHKEVCVVFDDLSRPARTSRLVPSLLRLFEKCGIGDEQVRFLCALGAHAPLDNAAFRKKLGEEALERFPVYNHNCYGPSENLGKTALGTPVLVNREYRSCDLTIGIGAFVPHAFCGYSGGYKIVMPGVAHIDSIARHHGMLKWEGMKFDLGNVTGDNAFLDDMKEFGRKAGLNIKIDLLINSDAEGTDIFAGDPESLYDYMLEKAPAHYACPVAGKADIVFANVYAKGNEAAIAVAQAEGLLKDEGGDIVCLCDTDMGQVVHYLFGRFGNRSWGPLAGAPRRKDPKVRRIFLCSRYKDLAGSYCFGREEDLFWFRDVSEIVKVLDDDYRGRTVDVHVIPDATIQTFPDRQSEYPEGRLRKS
jgi:nickel-dependent lactate racemase